MLMGRHRDEARATSGETGAVLVLFAVFMSVAVLLAAFVIDVGNFFEHQRHLQLQADSAAFAAAGKFQYPCSGTVEKAIYQTAGQYGGAATVLTPAKKSEISATPLYNTQIGGTSQANIHEEINSKTYFGQATGDTTTVEKAPCDPEAGMIDVKMTETNLPFFFNVLHKAFNVVPYINAHARVSIVKPQYATAVEPLIESEPVEARVFFVNDSPDGCHSQACYNSTAVLATGLLTNIGSNEEKGTIKWSDQSTPVAVNITAKHIGVRIALAGKAGALTGAGNEGVAVCTHAYVECFDEDIGVTPPLLHISGYSMEGEGTAVPLAPVAHKVTLSTPSPDTCTDAYFSNNHGPEKKSTCTLTLAAELQYGKESANTTGMTVTPQFTYEEGFSGKPETVKQPPLKLEGGVWTGTGNLPSWYFGNFGSTRIDLIVACKAEAKSPCEKGKTETKTLEDVQRAYSAGPDGSGRIVAAKVFEPGGANPVPGEQDAEAFEVCEPADAQKCEHKLAVSIELTGSLEDATKFFNKAGQPIPPFHIVYADNDQDIDDQFVVSCPPTTSSAGILPVYETALATGCAGKYSVNTHGGSCTVEGTTQKKIEAEEKSEKEAGQKEAAAKTKREAEERAAREKWAAEEKETKLTKAQRTEKEAAQTTTRQNDEKAEAAERKVWEEQEKGIKLPKITNAQRKEKETAQKATRVAREAEESAARTKWAAEETEFKITKAQREAKEREQTTARETAEQAEATAKAKRATEEQATKEAKEKLEGAAHECVGLVSVQNTFSSKHPQDEEELTATFQNYFAKRIENPVNGVHYYCPNKWQNNNEGGIPIIPANDSRLIQFFVVPFTVTDFERKNEVSPLIPINNFATFYVTGWPGDTCKSDDKPEVQGVTTLGIPDNREIIGHLIKYVNVLGEAPGTVTCKLEDLETCEAVLTE